MWFSMVRTTNGASKFIYGMESTLCNLAPSSPGAKEMHIGVTCKLALGAPAVLCELIESYPKVFVSLLRQKLTRVAI